MTALNGDGQKNDSGHNRVRPTLPLVRTQQFLFNSVAERFLNNDAIHEFSPKVNRIINFSQASKLTKLPGRWKQAIDDRLLEMVLNHRGVC